MVRQQPANSDRFGVGEATLNGKVGKIVSNQGIELHQALVHQSHRLQCGEGLCHRPYLVDGLFGSRHSLLHICQANRTLPDDLLVVDDRQRYAWQVVPLHQLVELELGIVHRV